MDLFEVKKLSFYLNNKFGSDEFKLKEVKREDSVEVYFKEEFIGLIYRDEEDGEVAYQFHMTILDEDLLDG
ncbi:DUF3126 family protein [Rickettsiales bacterium]|nr:DUF3126 family protein [Rickettsiales bacterium]